MTEMVGRCMRWCDMFDSGSEDDNPMLQRNTFPFYLFLGSFIDGLFNPRISLESMETLQARLQRDERVATLPPALQDIVLHFAFRPICIRR